MLHASIFAVGWLLFVWAQAQNSVRSTANGLQGLAGLKYWLKMQAVNVTTRAFFSFVFYGFIMNDVAAKISGAGFTVTGTSLAGISGYAANAILYQIFGLFPFLRVEVQDLAPPSAASAAAKPPDPPQA